MIDVGCLEDFKEKSIRLVTVKSTEIGIIRWHDEVFAFKNACPHQQGPLCAGSLWPRMRAKDDRPGSLDVDEQRPVISCPWHGWEFDIRDGSAVWDSRYHARSYPVHIKDGRVFVALHGGDSADSENYLG